MYWKVTFNIFPKNFTSQRGHTKIFIIFRALFISTQNKQITTLFTHFCKIEKFIFTSTVTNRVTPSVSPRWPRRRGPLTSDYSPSVRSSAVRIEPTWPPQRCALTNGTGWTSRLLQRPRRRRWRHGGVLPRWQRWSTTLSAKLRLCLDLTMQV